MRRIALNGVGSSDGRGLCWCGCGQAVDNYFKPGHDAKAKKYLCKLHYAGCPSNLPENVHGAEKSTVANLDDVSCVQRGQSVPNRRPVASACA